MRRTLFVAVLALMLVTAMGASAAFAGEVTGSGKGGPANDGIPGAVANGNSLCMFSGLEDEPFQPGVVQNWGHVRNSDFYEVIVVDHRGASWVQLIFFGQVFEEGCNAKLFPRK